MNSVLSEIIKQLNSSVFVLLAVLFGLGFLLWKVSAFITLWQYKHCEHNKKLSSAGEIKEKVIALETNISKAVEFGERIVRIETKLDLVYQKLSPNPFVIAQSPIALTAEGKEISKKIDAESTVNRIYPVISEMVEKSAPKTAYDIQESSFNIVREKLFSLLNDKEVVALKNEAFNKGMPVESFVIIYSILIRDRMLHEKNIPLNDVDTHDPKNQ